MDNLQVYGLFGMNFYDEDFVYHVRLKKVPQELKDEAAKYKPKYEVSYIKNRNLHMSNLELLIV